MAGIGGPNCKLHVRNSCHSVLYYIPLIFSDVNALVAAFGSQRTFGFEKPTEVFVNLRTVSTFVDI